MHTQMHILPKYILNVYITHLWCYMFYGLLNLHSQIVTCAWTALNLWDHPDSLGFINIFFKRIFFLANCSELLIHQSKCSLLNRLKKLNVARTVHCFKIIWIATLFFKHLITISTKSHYDLYRLHKKQWPSYPAVL